MKLKYVTMTGADDGTDITHLLELSKEFPFVEWGLLVSTKTDYRPRMPSPQWIYQLLTAAEFDDINLSLHICGKPVRDMLMGVFHERLTWLLSERFQRFQINTHAEKHEWDYNGITLIRSFGLKPIFQIDGINESLFDECCEDNVPQLQAIFDLSHGAGVLPKSWPKVYGEDNNGDEIHCTYAGGLGPENLSEQLKRIADVAGENTVSIDMETRVRSNNDQTFDLSKVRKCLEIAQPYTT